MVQPKMAVEERETLEMTAWSLRVEMTVDEHFLMSCG